MKKKVLYGLTLALFGGVSMGTLQSCKDDWADLEKQVVFNQKDFSGQIADIHKDLDPLVGPNGLVEKYHNELNDSVKNLRADIINNQKELQDALKDSLKQTDAATQAKLDDLQKDLNAISQTMESLVTTEALGKQVNNLDSLLRIYADSVAGARSAAVKVALESKINSEVADLKGIINNVDSALKVQIKGLDDKLEAHIKDYDKLVLRVDTLEINYMLQQAAINAANSEIEQLWQAINGNGGISEQISQIYNTMLSNFQEMNEKYDELAKNHAELEEAIFGDGGLRDQMSQYYNALRTEFSEKDEELWNALLERDELMTQYWNSLRNEFAEADQELWDHLEQLRNEMSMYYFASEAALQELRDEDAEIWNYIQGPNGLMEQMTMMNNRFMAEVDRLDGEIQTLKQQYDNMLGRFDALISGILIQATDNPIFGNFSLPLGIKTNMLFNWYGYNSQEAFKFPNAGSEYNYYDTDNALPLTAEDLRALNPSREDIAKGYLGEVDLGRLYLTVNPFNHNFDNTAFALETTNGERLPYELRVKKSNDKLYWGPSTRGTVEGNGFYSADVVMPATSAAVNATKIEIEEGLKSAAKDLLKDRSKRNALNLLKALYSQMSGLLPVYGVRYDWTADGKKYGVMSNYDLAVATARPLSYSFLYGKGTTKHLPTYGHLDNIFEDLINKDDFKFELNTSFEIEGFTISFDDLTFNFDINPKIEYDGKLDVTVTIPEQTCSGTTENGDKFEVTIPEQTAHSTVDPADLKGFIDAISDGFKNSIEEMNDKLNTQINQQIREKLIAGIQNQVNKMLDNIQSQINKMLSDLESQINGQISDMIDNIQSTINDKTGGLFNKVNDAIDVYNKVAGKINNVLSDPNHYLQVAMFYKGKGTVGILSNNKMRPTKFENAGGNAISLYASSYSAEILAPAFKKYVAVSNVYNADGTVNTAEKANIPAINEASGLNKVFPGVTKRVGVAASKLKKGLVYEIVYQGVDYSGKTSTQKFYITVK